MPTTPRRKSVTVNVGEVKIGGNNPIAVQSMTNTDTADITATVNQVMELARAGSELVRVTVNTEEAARAVYNIVERLRSRGVTIPLIGDFHYTAICCSRSTRIARKLLMNTGSTRATLGSGASRVITSRR